MCNPLTNKHPIPPHTAEEILTMKQKLEEDKLKELKRQHEAMGFIKDNMR